MLETLSALAGSAGSASGREATFWLPRRASSVAEAVDWNWAFVYWVCMFFFALVTFLLVFFVLRFRGASPEKTASHNTPLEVLWSVVPTLIVIVMFWQGYKTFLDMATPPQDAYGIQVTAQKWNWLFTYPNGYVDAELHVPRGVPVELTMSSQDVIHSFYVPDFRVKRDVMPGRYSKVWFEALDVGTFDIFCAEYCGTSHYSMLSKVHVHEPADYEAWLADASDFLKRMSPAEAGAMLYNQRGCKQCHSLDGTRGTGPSFLGLYGARNELVGGDRVLADENYIRESIVMPQAKIVAGYEPVMPTYSGRLKDEEISAIIAYLKTLGPARAE